MSGNHEMLAEIPMFALLDDAERAALMTLLTPRTFAAGETIFTYGDVGDSLHIVRRGKVEVFVESLEGEKVVLAENEAGDAFGEISVLDAGPRTATAVALEDCETLMLDRQGLLHLFQQHPHSALDLLSVMGRRLRATDELLRVQVTRNINVEEAERLTLGQRIADHVAAFGGSWPFIILFGVVLVVWMVVNTRLAARAFDPYPFILLNLVLSSLAALQAPVIMMSQNRQAFKDRLQAEMDYRVNLKAELEVAELHHKIDRHYEALQVGFDRLMKGGSPS
jgi:CRP/FNR family cyclic AMP-dependent transcriptional regulator